MKRGGALIALLAAVALGVLSLGPSPAYAGHGEGGNGHPGGHAHGGPHSGESYRGGYLTPYRIRIIRDYYSGRQGAGLPPGLRKHIERTGHLPPGLERRPLPPGLQKHLAVGQTLPPEYLREMALAPADLVSRLGPLPPDSRLYFYGGNAILLDPRTRAVLDIVQDVLTLSGR